MLPLKQTKVETLVGKGVFKLTCQREELILYSNDGSQSSEEWVEAISKAIVKHKSNSATLRKESSRRDPVKRYFKNMMLFMFHMLDEFVYVFLDQTL